jgi:hypothetical protein
MANQFSPSLGRAATAAMLLLAALAAGNFEAAKSGSGAPAELTESGTSATPESVLQAEDVSPGNQSNHENVFLSDAAPPPAAKVRNRRPGVPIARTAAPNIDRSGQRGSGLSATR